MEAAQRPELRVVTADGELVEGGLAARMRDLEDQLEGYRQTCEKQSRTIGSLQRRITEEEDPSSHPKGAEIVALIERWKRVASHEKSKVSADRVKMVKSRLRDGFTIEEMEFAVDGIGAFRYVVSAKRVREGHDSQRYDELSHALGSGEKLERAARLGYAARKQGWTPEGGWTA